MDNNEGILVDVILQSSSDLEEDQGWNIYDCGDVYCCYCGIDVDDDSYCSEEEEMNDEEEMNEEGIVVVSNNIIIIVNDLMWINIMQIEVMRLLSKVIIYEYNVREMFEYCVRDVKIVMDDMVLEMNK